MILGLCSCNFCLLVVSRNCFVEIHWHRLAVCFVQISHGPLYVMKVTGTCIQPGLQFSTTSHNFGVCFVARPDLPVETTVLKLTNTDCKDIRSGLSESDVLRSVVWCTVVCDQMCCEVWSDVLVLWCVTRCTVRCDPMYCDVWLDILWFVMRCTVVCDQMCCLVWSDLLWGVIRFTVMCD